MSESRKKEYLSLEEAADFMRIKVRTLRERAQRKQISFIREGGKLLRFDKDDLIAWMDKHKVKAIQS